MSQLKTISADKINNIDPNTGIILDVRTKMEHGEKRLSCGHTLVTLDELKPSDFMARHGYDKDFAVYILCRSGKRATQAAEQFMAEGYHNVFVIEGGILACEESGHPVVGHTTNENSDPLVKKPMSLERQVRITAGAFAAIGAALGLTVSSAFTIIPLFVGAGLVFAGITDRCGMALVLTKAPWNQISGQSCGRGGCGKQACSSSAPNAAPTSVKPESETKGQSCQ